MVSEKVLERIGGIDNYELYKNAVLDGINIYLDYFRIDGDVRDEIMKHVDSFADSYITTFVSNEPYNNHCNLVSFKRLVLSHAQSGHLINVTSNFYNFVFSRKECTVLGKQNPLFIERRDGDSTYEFLDFNINEIQAVSKDYTLYIYIPQKRNDKESTGLRSTYASERLYQEMSNSFRVWLDDIREKAYNYGEPGYFYIAMPKVLRELCEKYNISLDDSNGVRAKAQSERAERLTETFGEQEKINDDGEEQGEE